MRKDIEIPEVKDVVIAIVKEYNEEFVSDAWYAYLFNNTAEPIEAIMIVSQATGIINEEIKQSGLFRHAFKSLEPGESQKVELLDESIFKLDNDFMLTFFQNGRLMDKTFTFKANTISEEALQKLPFADKNGVVIK